MLRGSRPRLSGYTDWPWPSKLPLKHNHWFHSLPTVSYSQEARAVISLGDVFVLGLLVWSAQRFYEHHTSGAYDNRMSHLVNHPPAIIANDFDFKNPENNRTVCRGVLDDYREEVVRLRAARAPLETSIFKY